MDYLKKIFYLIPNIFYNKIILLFFLLIASVFFELLGIGLILPTISIIAEGKFLVFEDQFTNFVNYLQINSIHFILILLVILFIVKTIFYLIFHWYQFSFAAALNSSIVSKLFKKYIYAKYDFYLKNNSSTLIRNVTGESDVFIKKLILPLIHLVADVLILFGLLLVLLLVEYKSVLIILFTYLIFGSFFFISIKNILKKTGEGRLYHSQKRILYSQSSFQGIKSIKIYLKEELFTKLYKFYTDRYLRLRKTESFLMSIPRHFFELLTVSIFAVLIIFFFEGSDTFIQVIPKLTLFAAAAVKLVPSINKIIVNLQIMKTGVPCLNNLYNEFKNLEKINLIKKEVNKFIFKNNITLDNLSFSYDEDKKYIFEKINLNIPKNSCIGIMGKTGAGKSTFLDIILGLAEPKSGKVLVDNFNIQENLRGWQNNIGYVPQEIFLLDDTLKNNITLTLDGAINYKLLKEAIELSQIFEFLDTSQSKLDEIIGEKGVRLSGGQRQRIGIARALYKNPELIVLDEATSSLDINTESKIIKDLNKIKGKKTIIIVSHRPSALDICDEVYEVKDQKIFKK